MALPARSHQRCRCGRKAARLGGPFSPLPAQGRAGQRPACRQRPFGGEQGEREGPGASCHPGCELTLAATGHHRLCPAERGREREGEEGEAAAGVTSGSRSLQPSPVTRGFSGHGVGGVHQACSSRGKTRIRAQAPLPALRPSFPTSPLNPGYPIPA